jgi:hypothetical protein
MPWLQDNSKYAKHDLRNILENPNPNDPDELSYAEAEAREQAEAIRDKYARLGPKQRARIVREWAKLELKEKPQNDE